MIELKKESERVLLVGVGLPGQDDVEDSSSAPEKAHHHKCRKVHTLKCVDRSGYSGRRSAFCNA